MRLSHKSALAWYKKYNFISLIYITATGQRMKKVSTHDESQTLCHTRTNIGTSCKKDTEKKRDTSNWMNLSTSHTENKTKPFSFPNFAHGSFVIGNTEPTLCDRILLNFVCKLKLSKDSIRLNILSSEISFMNFGWWAFCWAVNTHGYI